MPVVGDSGGNRRCWVAREVEQSRENPVRERVDLPAVDLTRPDDTVGHGPNRKRRRDQEIVLVEHS